MPPASIQGIAHIGHRYQQPRPHPAYALQQVPQLDPAPSQPYRRSLDVPPHATPTPYHPLQAKSHAATFDRRGGHERHHDARVVPVSEASHVATDGSPSGRSRSKSLSSLRTRDVRPHRHEYHRQEAARHQNKPLKPGYQPPSTQSDKRATHDHSDHWHAHGHRPHSHTNPTQPSHDHGHAPSQHQHHRLDDAPDSGRLGASYKPTPPPSDDSSSRGRSSIDIEEPHPRSLSVPQHRSLRPGRSAMKHDYNRGRRGSSGCVHFLVADPEGQDADHSHKAHSWGHGFGWSRTRWPGSKKRARR
ncbi:hypothetical protein PENSPDRAFT_693770 [Peniophora sp. CONT]|nr:hypothetical protein PENSPDRAFT_693770 [Peniophora sp. CONT]